MLQNWLLLYYGDAGKVAVKERLETKKPFLTFNSNVDFYDLLNNIIILENNQKVIVYDILQMKTSKIVGPIIRSFDGSLIVGNGKEDNEETAFFERRIALFLKDIPYRVMMDFI